MAVQARTPWEKDKAYPMKTTDCSVCGITGLMKQAFDRQQWICISAGPCLKRAHDGKAPKE